ncbi:MAG TPA: PAS domain S-box protein, partial [Terriglobia bacterium]|nr:PAS domain S-box protein [Terriglobia bacterium]
MKKHALKVSDHKRLVTQKLHILVVEDNDNDYALLLAELKRADIDFESMRVQVRDDFNRQLKDRKPDLIISDYMLPKFTGLEALRLAQKFDPFIPVIICTGSVNEETAVECIKAGAADYVLKEQMTRFGPAVRSALELKRERIENDQNQRELQKLSSAVQQAADSIVITDANGIIEFVNPTFERTTGYTREEVVGKNPRILKSGHHAKEFYKKLWDTILAGKTFYAEFLNKKKDGTEYYQEEKISPILDENGRVTHFVSTGRDITERKKAQEALRQSEERYRQVVESASEVIFTTDLSGRFTNANRAALRVTGFTLDELRRHKYTDLVLPEYRKKLRMLYMRQVVGREPASYVEYPFRVKSGDTKWFGQTGSLLTLDEKVAGFNLIARDITARKLAEEALRRSEDRYKILFEQNPECMWVFDPGTLRFLAVNQAAISHYGYSREEFLGMTIADIRPADEVGALKKNVAGKHRRMNVQEEWKHRRKDGTVFDVEITAHDILFEGT